MPWGMVYSHVDNQPRHPSELYEFGLEGVCLFLLVWIYASRPRPTGRVSAVFLMGYAVCRIIAEFSDNPIPIRLYSLRMVDNGANFIYSHAVAGSLVMVD